ncbi:hypothetical protein DQ04_02511100 [Trypanosoma grayi]|uniref:hypothetical protein n=1 Tax=Trypanosoma grayi TaxID=71804 RepID=UPI0004F4325E|nr:hypothetical protein DQ04_02511100 [Trypanosoma grayi]KEG11551.1 hypothetical protein DQ04_02511100 [Trypanosoma grayi]
MSKMAKKRGLTMDEKVSRVEEWFVAHPVPYTLKDLVAALPKATGVIPQSVEECLEILVSEGRVQQKKVGIHVLFWRFPKTAAQQLASAVTGGTAEVTKFLSMSTAQVQGELDLLVKKEEDTCKRIQEVRAAIGEETLVQQDAEKMRELQKELQMLQAQLEQLSMFDPQMIEKVKAATFVAWEAANRWTDNMYLLQHHITRRLGLSARDLRSQLQLPSDIDYIEYDDLLSGFSAAANSVATATVGHQPSPLRQVEGDANVETDAATMRDADTPAALENGTPEPKKKTRKRFPDRTGEKNEQNMEKSGKRTRDDSTARPGAIGTGESTKEGAVASAAARTAIHRRRKKAEA